MKHCKLCRCLSSRGEEAKSLKCGLHRGTQRRRGGGQSRPPAGRPGEHCLLCGDAVVSTTCSLPVVMCRKCSPWSSVPGTAFYLLISPARSWKGNLLFCFRSLTVVPDLDHFRGAPSGLSSPSWQAPGWLELSTPLTSRDKLVTERITDDVCTTISGNLRVGTLRTRKLPSTPFPNQSFPSGCPPSPLQ